MQDEPLPPDADYSVMVAMLWYMPNLVPTSFTWN